MGTQFLALPFSSQELSVGTHPVLLGHSPVNPALYSAFQNQPSVSFNHGTWFGDVALTQVGYNFAKNNMSNHLGIKYSGITDLEFRDDVPRDDPLAEFSSFGMVLDAGTAIIQGNQRYGLSLSYIHFGLYTYQANGFGLNFGYAADLNSNIRIGVAVQNLGRITTLKIEKPTLPRRILVGASKDLTFGQFKNVIYGSLESNSIAPNLKIHFGNHFNWNRFNLYIGFSSSNEVFESSFGFGLLMNRFEMQYGIRIGSQNIGIPQIISIRFLLL